MTSIVNFIYQFCFFLNTQVLNSNLGCKESFMDSSNVEIKDLLRSHRNIRSDLRSCPIAKLRKGLAVDSFRLVSLILLDSIALSLAWWLAIRYGRPIDSPWVEKITSFRLVSLIFEIIIIAARGLYKSGAHRRNYVELIKTISLASILLMLVAFLYDPKQYVSRSIFLLSWFLSIGFVCTLRFVFDQVARLVRETGAIRYPVFLIADINERSSIIKLIEQENCYNLIGVADAVSLDKDNREATFFSLRRLGVEEVFVSWLAIKNRLHLCWHFQAVGITLRLLPTELQAVLSRAELSFIGGVPSPTIRAPLILGGDYWVKRHFDKGLAFLLLLLLSPIYFVIAVLIKLDSPGPVFFRQTRIGLHGQKFKVWKFRTMVANAAELQAVLEAKNEMKDGVLFKLKDDPRVTRTGKILRRFSLDELPQLFNVLTGEMSLVGPRPLPVRDVERFQEKHFIRQEVLPGITGLWQVSGRSDIDNFEEAFNLDLTYITNWSLQLDLEILFRTIQVVIQRSGAY
jgi:exopolysaccharide biosynthesis polyprenyl glycosylphosphotransferase